MVMKAIATKLGTRTIAAGKFKAQCLQIMDEVLEQKLTVVVTKRGKPVVDITAHISAKPKKPRSFIGSTKGSITSHGDIIAALPNEWSALERD